VTSRKRSTGTVHGATAVAVFTTDVAIRRLAEKTDSIVRWTEFDRGGHLAAREASDLLLADLRAFTRPLQ
jgi:hypothetical protein